MRAESLLLSDDKARREALDISQSFIVQAPAGSGKTELLIQRYLALLAVVQNPEEVLAITFTRKAAQEMSNRVVKALSNVLLDEDTLEPHRRTTRDLAMRVLQRDEELGWRLVESPRRMRIQTLDAFCAGLARSQPVSSGLGGALTTLVDSDMRAMYRQAAAATMDWLIADDDRSKDIALLLGHLDINTGVYIEHLARMLATRDQWLDLVGSGVSISPGSSQGARARLEDNLSRYVSAKLASARQEIDDAVSVELVPLLRYAARSLAEAGQTAHAMLACEDLEGLPGHAPSDLASWRAIAGLLLKQDGDWRKSVTRNDGFPPGDSGEKKRIQELLAQLAGCELLRGRLQRILLLPEPRYDDRQWDVLLALFRLLPVAVAELRRLFSENGVSDHTEVALAAGAALGDPDRPGDATLRLDYVIRHILLDEMQDTSVGQYKLLEKLTGGWTPGDGRTLFCVGDPMQSIYRFRDAEVGRFLQIQRSGIGAIKPAPLVLRRNFRSGEHLVHWFNTVFSQVFPAQDNIIDGAIGYTESMHVESKSTLGEYRVYPMFGASPEEEAAQATQVVRNCVEGHQGKSTALLVRSRTQLPSVLRQLRDAGIEYRAIEIDRLTDLPEIIDLVALTRALCHEGDRLAWLALLRGPWVGLAWADLHQLVVNDTTSTVTELIADPARWSALSADATKRITKFLDAIASSDTGRSTRTLRDRIETAWYALGGPASLHNRDQLENVYRYLSVVENLESAGTLVDIQELESRLDGERVSSLAEDPAALQVMTMHKAKGLEFDNVILHALGRSTRGRSRPLLSWLNIAADDGRFEILMSPIGRRADLEKDRLHQCIEFAESDKDKLELDRLLYVACTRARQSLHLIGNVPVKSDGKEFARPPAGSLLDRLWPALEEVYRRAFASGEGIHVGTREDLPLLQLPGLRRFRNLYQLPVPPEMPVVAALPESSVSNPDVEFYWVGRAARYAGTIVHALLKGIADGRINANADTLNSLEPAIARRAVELGVAQESLDEVTRRVVESLRGILADARGQWLISGEGHAEYPLTGKWNDHIVSILIDRVRIDNGVHWIVDYKTSSHEGGDLESFLDQEADRYRAQLQKYATLYRRTVDAEVRTALYFPLLQAFREVPVAGMAKN